MDESAPLTGRMLSPERILQIAGGLRASEILFSGLELGLFTELAKGPRSLRQLRQALGVDERAAADFLDAIVALGLVGREGSGREAIYVNTREAGHFLDSKSAAYIGAQLIEANARFAPLWKRLTDELRARSPGRNDRLDPPAGS